jgi:uncharacterized protein YjbJ (UPF0337 family)
MAVRKGNRRTGIRSRGNFPSQPEALPKGPLACTWIARGILNMEDSTKDKIEGEAHRLKGKVKESIGHATGNPDMVADGKEEKADGKAQKNVGKLERKIEKVLQK